MKRFVYSLLASLFIACAIYLLDTTFTPSSPQLGEKPHFFSNQTHDDLRKGFVSAIESAKTSIHLMVFSLKDPFVIAALNASCKRGVKVYVTCDHNFSPRVQEKLAPDIHLVRRFGKGLMHLKILVIDQTTCWIGSANFTGESLRMHGNIVGVFPSKELASFIIEKYHSLMPFKRESLFPHQSFLVGGQSTELWFLPDNQDAVKTLLGLISTAKKTIHIAMYTFTRKDLAEALLDAKKRGIKVEVALDRSQTMGVNKKIAHLFKKAHIPTYFNGSKGLLHYKFLHIDDTILVQGSANWTKAAFSENDDCFIITRNLTEQQNAFLNTLFEVIRTSDSPLVLSQVDS